MDVEMKRAYAEEKRRTEYCGAERRLSVMAFGSKIKGKMVSST